MTDLLPSPRATSDPTLLADWIEIKALLSADHNASIQDLIAEIRRYGSTDALSLDLRGLSDSGGELSEQVASDAFSEIEERADAAGPGYPFVIEEQHIQFHSAVDVTESTYVFLLLLSSSGMKESPQSQRHPERDFEDISLKAAEHYFGSNEHDGSYAFGFPRRRAAAAFPAAVDELSDLLGEGGGAIESSLAAQQKDAHLDLVVWHGFPDRKPGQVIAFGQCATGRHWRRKITELPEGDVWCRAWMIDPPAVSPIRMLFLPHRLNEDQWRIAAILGGVLFDRCRIAYHAPKVPRGVSTNCAAWVREVLN